MNWKKIVGILLIFGAASELYREIKDTQTGVTGTNYYIPELLCIAVIGAGFYLVKKGMRKKTSNT